MKHTRGSACFPLTHNALHFTVNAALELIEWALKKETRPSTFPSALSKHPETGVQHTHTHTHRASLTAAQKRLRCQSRTEGKTDLVINSFIKRLDSMKWPKYIYPVVPN